MDSPIVRTDGSYDTFETVVKTWRKIAKMVQQLAIDQPRFTSQQRVKCQGFPWTENRFAVWVLDSFAGGRLSSLGFLRLSEG